MALITDVRMPELGGRALVARLQEDVRALPVVYVSGYAEEGESRRLGPHEGFVEKPFTTEALLAALGHLPGAGTVTSSATAT